MAGVSSGLALDAPATSGYLGRLIPNDSVQLICQMFDRRGGDSRVGRADLHVHTTYSDGLPSLEQVLRFADTRTDLDILAITDHDTIEGALRARDWAAGGRYRFEVVVGCEVTTREGHLLALFIEKPLRALRPVVETITEVHEQGGLCIAPHPLSWLTRSLGARSLDQIHDSQDNGVHLDGIEIWNPSIAGRITRDRAIALNQRYGLAETGSSDAHFLGHIGMAYTEFDGAGVTALRQALINRTTRAKRAEPRPEHQIPVSELARQQVKSLIELPSRRVSGFVRRRWTTGRRETSQPRV